MAYQNSAKLVPTAIPGSGLTLGYLSYTPSTSNTIGANVLRAFPVWLQKTQPIVNLSIEVTTGIVAGYRVGLYRSDAISGYPTDLIQATMSVALNPATAGFSNVAVANTVLSAGLYYLAYWASAAITHRSVPTTAVYPFLGRAAGNVTSYNCFSVNLSWNQNNPLPNSFPAGGTRVVAGVPNVVIT